jgi:hypothetical protein
MTFGAITATTLSKSASASGLSRTAGAAGASFMDAKAARRAILEAGAGRSFPHNVKQPVPQLVCDDKTLYLKYTSA